MSAPADPPKTDTPLPLAFLGDWLAQSHDLLALSTADGTLQWANGAFMRATGLTEGDDLLALAPAEHGFDAARSALADALATGQAPGGELGLRHVAGQPLWVRARVLRNAQGLLWTLQDTTDTHALEARAQHLSEVLDLAQEFGRLGVWEREIPSGAGRWDRHVFGFWGLTPTDAAPDHLVARAHVHPEDRNSLYLDSTRQAGRYAQQYRVIRADGSERRIHSQWEVKNSPEGVPARTIGIMMDDTQVHEMARMRDAAAAELRLVTRLADIVIWRHDFKTDRIYYNEHGYKVLGIPYRPDGLTLEEARGLTHPDDVYKLAASSAHALATGVPIDVEVRHRRSDGVWRYILVRRVIERSEAGEPIAFVGVSLDVTEQVEQARLAEQLARRLEAAAEAARIGIWTLVLGSRQTEWNAQMFALFDQAGRTEPPGLRDWLRSCVHPEDRARVTATLRGLLRRERRGFELEFRTPGRFGATRWMVLRANLDRSGGDPARVFGIAMDVTDRHEALTELHAASERAALIARHAGIGTWETDAEGRPARWDAQMFTLRGLEPRAETPDREERLSLVHPDDRRQLLDNIPGINAAPAAYEFRVRLPDGSYRWLASRSAPLLDEHGRLLRRVGVNWDITEAKNADLARQQALLTARESQAKSQFLSRMSHELRTPLNAVLGFTQLLQLEARQSPERNQLARLGHIRAAGEHLLALIDDALDLSDLQAGTLKLEIEPVALAMLVGRAMDALAPLAESHGVDLHEGPLGCSVMADQGRLRQVVHNLLTNAIRHNVRGGRVNVEAVVEGEQVLLEVRDTGRGMDAEQTARLFEPFADVGGHAEEVLSPGLGLAIARALIDGMGGSIAARSELGRGTTFSIRLPQAVERPPQPPAGAVRRSGLVLYIEDNGVNVLLVEELVKSLSGLRIVSEATGTGGVERARELRPDLILIDMHLPDFDGYEVLRRLRSSPETVGIPCIALSANAMPDDIALGLEKGFDDYWTKPIKFRPFLQALEQLFPVVSA